MISPERRAKKFRVAEVFGPTIQGEGRLIGTPCAFVRFGGCDYRCSWCDTPHAVLPEMVNILPQLAVWEIIDRLNDLGGMSPDWVVLSGGNPALFDLEYLIELLHVRQQKVMLETQGSIFKQWFGEVDDLCFSPKPPSSGNVTRPTDLGRVLEATISAQTAASKEKDQWPFKMPYLKVVIFDEADYEYAIEVHNSFRSLEMFVSVGNADPSLPTVGNPNPPQGLLADNLVTQEIVLDKMRWLMEKMLTDQRMNHVRVLPQLHTLAWGNQRGR